MRFNYAYMSMKNYGTESGFSSIMKFVFLKFFFIFYLFSQSESEPWKRLSNSTFKVGSWVFWANPSTANTLQWMTPEKSGYLFTWKYITVLDCCERFPLFNKLLRRRANYLFRKTLFVMMSVLVFSIGQSIVYIYLCFIFGWVNKF